MTNTAASNTEETAILAIKIKKHATILLIPIPAGSSGLEIPGG
jgi:hypothetical protein